MRLTNAQKRLFCIVADATDAPLSTDTGVEMEDHEERTALALEKKGLLRVDGDMFLTEKGIAFANTLKK